ncbi:MAG TPA: hypothetical protein ENJ53_06455 [Phaeodactylibacter sp.]|nr:hypothetical protein [Phaeodactylibacter sp.]
MKKRNLLFLSAVIILLLGCAQDADFEQFTEMLEKRANPSFLEMDADADLVFLQNQLKKLNHFDIQKLDEENKIRWQTTKVWIEKKIKWYADDLKHNPMAYSVIRVLQKEVKDSMQTNEEQFSKILNRLEEIPVCFSKAKKILQSSDKEKLNTSISEFSKDYFYLKNDLSLLIRKPDILKERQIDFSQKNEKAQLATKDFIAFLNSLLFETGERNDALQSI